MNIDWLVAFTFILLTLTVSGAFLVYYQLRRQWFDHRFEDRKIRQKNYRLLIHDISEAAALGDDESRQKLIARLDGLWVIASSCLVPKLLEFQKFMRVSNVRVLRNSEIWREQRDALARGLIQSLREDIYGYEPITGEILVQWRPLSRPIRKPGIRFEVIPFKRSMPKSADSDANRQKHS